MSYYIDNISHQFKYLKLVFSKCNPFCNSLYMLIDIIYIVVSTNYPTRAHARTHAQYKNYTNTCTCFRTNTDNTLYYIC